MSSFFILASLLFISTFMFGCLEVNPPTAEPCLNETASVYASPTAVPGITQNEVDNLTGKGCSV